MQSDTTELPAAHAPDAAPKQRLRTLSHLDGRTKAARRVHDLIATIEGDLGGSESLSEGARQLVQRAAVLGARIEDFEAAWISGTGPDDPSEYLASIGVQRRLFMCLGLQRVPRDVTDDIRTYTAAADAAAAEPARPFSIIEAAAHPNADERTSGLATRAGAP